MYFDCWAVMVLLSIVPVVADQHWHSARFLKILASSRCMHFRHRPCQDTVTRHVWYAVAAAGLSVKAFDGSDRLRDFFNVISVTADRDGVFYVSTMEAKKVQVTRRSLFARGCCFFCPSRVPLPSSPAAGNKLLCLRSCLVARLPCMDRRPVRSHGS